MMLAWCLGIAVLVSAATAFEYQDNARCCMPQKFEGGSTSYTPSHGVYIRQHSSFDFTNKKVASCVRFSKKPFKRHYDVRAIVDFQRKKRYYIYKLFGKTVCRVLPIKSNIPLSNCLPSQFRRLGSYNVGGAGRSQPLSLTAWGLFSKKYVNVLSVSAGCVPVTDSVTFQHRRLFRTESIYTHAGWFNLTSGIRNATVFNPPPECQKSDHFNTMQLLKALKVPAHRHSEHLQKIEEHLLSFHKVVGAADLSEDPLSRAKHVHAELRQLQEEMHNTASFYDKIL